MIEMGGARFHRAEHVGNVLHVHATTVIALVPRLCLGTDWLEALPPNQSQQAEPPFRAFRS